MDIKLNFKIVTDTKSRPYVPFTPVVNEDNISFVVDGLNLTAAISTSIVNSRKKKGHIRKSRTPAHQLENKEEIFLACANIKTFFEKYIPENSTVFFVLKEFEPAHIMENLTDCLNKVFVESSMETSITYVLDIVSPLDSSDTECDDRHVAFITDEIMTSHPESKIFVVSNDKYRSLSTHIDKPSYFVRGTIHNGDRKLTSRSAYLKKLDLTRLRKNKDRHVFESLGKVNKCFFGIYHR
jgi:hypothetical protein